MSCVAPAIRDRMARAVTPLLITFGSFPVIEGVRWTYRVHEQILPALKRAGVPVEWTEIIVRHTGYSDRALRFQKARAGLPHFA